MFKWQCPYKLENVSCYICIAPLLNCNCKSRFQNKNTWKKIKYNNCAITKQNDTARNGYIRMSQEKSAKFAYVLMDTKNVYVNCFINAN